jgi:hypothetical protein
MQLNKLLDKEKAKKGSYGQEVCFYLGNLHVFSTLRVLVVSMGSWMWAIAWAQVGAMEIDCCPLHASAAEDLVKCTLWLPSLRQRAVRDLEKDMGRYDVVCVQVENDKRDLLVALAAAQLLMLENLPFYP